jgi:hypothetical protein
MPRLARLPDHRLRHGVSHGGALLEQCNGRADVLIEHGHYLEQVSAGCAGYSNADVALVFVLSPKPLRNHVSNTFTKQVARPVLCDVTAPEAGLGRRGGTAPMIDLLRGSTDHG